MSSWEDRNEFEAQEQLISIRSKFIGLLDDGEQTLQKRIEE
jgi:hypothetical protein